MSWTLAIVRAAFEKGHRVNTKKDLVLGISGRPLKLNTRLGVTYPHVTLTVRGLARKSYSVPAHKVVAYAVYGEAAFEPGIQVRHLDGDRLNLRASNLKLGTASVNAMDKPAHVRQAIARKARAAQGDAAWNRRFTATQIEDIRRQYRAGRGVVELARELRVHHSTIGRIVSRKHYVKKRSPRLAPAMGGRRA